MKRILEVDDEEVVILLKPRKDNEGDWNHSTNIHFPKKHNDEYDVVSAISDLARAMVGFSYGSDHEEVIEYIFEKGEEPFSIEKMEDGLFNVVGAPLKKIFDMTDFTKDQSVKRFSRILRSLGIDARLRENGVKNGDTVRIFMYEFEFLD